MRSKNQKKSFAEKFNTQIVQLWKKKNPTNVKGNSGWPTKNGA